MSDLHSLLDEFAELAGVWFGERPFVEDNYHFVQVFFEPDHLQGAEWEDFQEMGKRSHALSSHRLAYESAVGNPNHPIEHYRYCFDGGCERETTLLTWSSPFAF